MRKAAALSSRAALGGVGDEDVGHAGDSKDSIILKAMAAGRCDVALVHTCYLGRVLANDPKFPVAPFWPDQRVHTVLAAWGPFKADGIGVAKAADLQDDGARLAERAGWKSLPVPRPDRQGETARPEEVRWSPDRLGSKPHPEPDQEPPEARPEPRGTPHPPQQTCLLAYPLGLRKPLRHHEVHERVEHRPPPGDRGTPAVMG